MARNDLIGLMLDLDTEYKFCVKGSKEEFEIDQKKLFKFLKQFRKEGNEDADSIKSNKANQKI